MEKQQILIVDNDPNFIDLSRKYLNSHLDIKVATSREEGLQKAVENIPDIIIIGFLEPRGDSFFLHQDIRENQITKHIPLFIIDVRPEEHSLKGWRREEGMQMEAEGYFSRPVGASKLKDEIEKCLVRASLKQMELERRVKEMGIAFTKQMKYKTNILRKQIGKAV